MNVKEFNEHVEENQPKWLRDYEFEYYDIDSIQRGGCASGAFMPAVTYYEAKKFMGEWGDHVLEYIEEVLGEIPKFNDDISWAGLACYYFSMGVELWAGGFDLEEVEED